MKISFSVLKNENIIKSFLIVISIILLISIFGFNNIIDKKIENVFELVRGQQQPDTNIVLITINSNDIDNVGPWPLKRSYYALLINSLTKYKVKIIGLEIFLSAKFVTQSIYDNLLTKEIQKSNRVVLSSVAGRLYLKDGMYFTDSLSYPSPKLIDNNLKTGHLNYLTDNGFQIPLVIHDHNIIEKSFAYQIASELHIVDSERKLNVNFISSWKRFKRYGLLEYFRLVHEHSRLLNNLKNKIVLIGITDPQIALTGKTAFDDALPGLALHAFVLDNLLEHRWLTSDMATASGYLFIFIIFIFLYFNVKRKINTSLRFYAIAIIGFILISYILFSYFNILLSYIYFLIPLLLLGIIELYFLLIKNKQMLDEAMNEKDMLNDILSAKIRDLTRLQEELNVAGENNSELLISKIKTLKSEISKLKKDGDDKIPLESGKIGKLNNFYGIVYKSKSMANVIELVKKTAPEDANILILGESGTGKELIAHAVHALNGRKDLKFIVVNCGALSDTLLESELFGHVKGAFTGAVTDKVGRFEAADKGTIFLDEIGETSENFQVKLLRVIQSGDFEKVGSSKTSHVNVKIIAATNKNLEKEVKEKRFREDLYYRLNVIKIELPPLRDRKEDIEILAHYFLSNESAGLILSKAVVNALQNYKWKGNIRELEAVIKRASIFAKSAGRNLVHLSDLPDEIVKGSMINFDDVVIETLRSKNFSHSSISETAVELGNISRTMISENFRGRSLKAYIESGFDEEKAVRIIAGNTIDLSKKRVRAKLKLFLKNIENDILKLDTTNFEQAKLKFSSKYKNLPQKFHSYLDEIIRHKLK